jgi:hypothetical protein
MIYKASAAGASAMASMVEACMVEDSAKMISTMKEITTDNKNPNRPSRGEL